MCDDSFAIAPLFGWSWHGKHIRDRHLRDNGFLDENFDNVPPVERAEVARRSELDDSSDSSSDSSSSSSSYSHNNKDHSRYHARWDGPFVGFDFDYRFGLGCDCEQDWEIFGTYEYHFSARYHASARWKLRRDLIDGFTHRVKNFYGHIFDIGIRYDFCECWTLAVKGEFQWWFGRRGRDRAKIGERHLGNIDTDCFLSIPLRDVRTHSAAVMVDVGMVF